MDGWMDGWMDIWMDGWMVNIALRESEAFRNEKELRYYISSNISCFIIHVSTHLAELIKLFSFTINKLKTKPEKLVLLLKNFHKSNIK